MRLFRVAELINSDFRAKFIEFSDIFFSAFDEKILFDYEFISRKI
jgi:hypothetical protein